MEHIHLYAPPAPWATIAGVAHYPFTAQILSGTYPVFNTRAIGKRSAQFSIAERYKVPVDRVWVLPGFNRPINEITGLIQ